MFILFVGILLTLVGKSTSAKEQDNVWNNTVNYLNIPDYTDEQLLDREAFSTMVGVSDEYLIVPLYNLQEKVSAYVIQYYDSHEPLSYIVINTRTNVTDDYYITFGQGDFADFVGLSTIKSEVTNIRVCYCGGSEFYLEAGERVFHFNGDLEELDYNTVMELSEQTVGDYYVYGETLNLAAVLNKEVGYLNCPFFLRNTSFTKRTIDMTRYAYGAGTVCYNHCAPTAGLNLFQYLYTVEGKTNIPMSSWTSVFVNLHTAMGTTNDDGTSESSIAPALQSVLQSYGYSNAFSYCYNYATWNMITAAIDTNAVFLCLYGSEIYHNHAVLALGYVSFIHSSGWVSKYYIIVDGQTSDIRYVHSSLGISHFSLITVNTGT